MPRMEYFLSIKEANSQKGFNSGFKAEVTKKFLKVHKNFYSKDQILHFEPKRCPSIDIEETRVKTKKLNKGKLRERK